MCHKIGLSPNFMRLLSRMPNFEAVMMANNHAAPSIFDTAVLRPGSPTDNFVLGHATVRIAQEKGFTKE